MTRTHTVANISDLINGKVTIKSKDDSMLCPKHDEKLKFFCVTCLEPVCHDCTLIDHNREQGHQLQFLKDFVPTIREELSSRKEEVSKKSEEFSEFLNLADELETHTMDKTKTTSKSIQNAIVEYISRVEEERLPMEKVACDYLGEKIEQLNQLRKKTQHIKSLAEKSLLLTNQIMENEQDLVGLASMYKSLREAMDRAIAEKPDEQKLKNIRKSIDHLHYHVTPLDAKVGKVAVGCSCTERSTSSVACKNGPKDVQFTRDGRISAIVQAACIGGTSETVYVMTGNETVYTLQGSGFYNTYTNLQHQYMAVNRGVYQSKEVKNLEMFAAIKQTTTSFPNCTSFSWTRWLPTLQYDSIRCFTSLSDHRFVIATTDAKLYILGDTLGEFSHGLPDTRSISGLATDNEDNIYITDRDNHKIYILRSDGNLKDTLNVGDISPTCVAVPHMGPEIIAVTHEPATVSILDLNGNTLCSIHNEEWKKVAIGCDADRLLYILWSDQNNEKTLQRYTFQGVQVDTLFEKESHSYNDLVLAVSPTGACAAAVVTTTGADGKVVTMAPGEKPSPGILIAMASSNINLLDSVVSEEVECAICLNKLDTPRILTCLHSFCEKCLEKCVQNRKDDSSQSGNSTLKCALCNEYTVLPDTGVRGLRLDFRATRLVEALREKETRELKLASPAHRCEACGCTDSGETASTEKSPFTYCRECCQVLCQRCSKAHAGLRMTRTHTVANISDLINGKVTIQSKDDSMLCPKHDEKLKFFCVTCLEPVCHDCTLIDHNREQGHQLQFLKDFVPTIREELSSRKEEVSKKSEEFSEFLNLADELETHIMDKTKTTSKSIQNAIVEYSSRVEEARLQMEKVACDYLGEKIEQLNQLRKKTQHIKSLAEKSLLLTNQIMENEQDLVGLASMYKSLREAMDRAIAEKPDEQELENIREYIDHLHYHVTPLDAKVGKVAVGCSCTERSTLSITCKNGPKDVQFTRDGRISAIVQVVCIGEGQGTVYVKHGTETLYTCFSRSRDDYRYKAVKNLEVFAAIKQTSTSFPNCTSFSWTRWLPTLQYDSIRCFTSLSDHRFVIATTDAKLYILGDTLAELSHGLPGKQSISGLATDNEDNIYITDRDNHKIYILRSDGNLTDTLKVEDISPICVAVPHMVPDVIAVTHEPATVSILDLNGNTLCSIHNEEWKKVAIGCDADRLLYILWSDQNNEKTLQRYTFQGVQVDTLFEKESHSYNDLVLAVSPTGASAAAIVTTTGADGQVVTVAPGEKPSPKTLL
ncbi:uncharacterized protein LOC105446170 [Strongylocentrotus purpuratus]|uniref:Uncharacterized protein n=1 Tax=Strongylocentrotus purpuratus TaxID=7668 RepID=A0A7M7NJ98_STRPU|nr:uncharacterized protein LOC105446170 [Strongylocentrotus purpuratus]